MFCVHPSGNILNVLVSHERNGCNYLFQFHCCGVVNYEDWYMIDNWQYRNWVPDSCCKNYEVNCGQSHDPEMWFSGGCSGQVHMWFVQRLHIVGVVGLAVAFIQVRNSLTINIYNCFVNVI